MTRETLNSLYRLIKRLDSELNPFQCRMGSRLTTVPSMLRPRMAFVGDLDHAGLDRGAWRVQGRQSRRIARKHHKHATDRERDHDHSYSVEQRYLPSRSDDG